MKSSEISAAMFQSILERQCYEWRRGTGQFRRFSHY